MCPRSRGEGYAGYQCAGGLSKDGKQLTAQRVLWVALIGGRGPGNRTLKRWLHSLGDRPQEKLELWWPAIHILEKAPAWNSQESRMFPDFPRLRLRTAQVRDVSIAIDIGTALTSDTTGPLAQSSIR